MADLGEPDGSEPGYNRPVLIVRTDAFNRSRLHTVVVVVLTTTFVWSTRPKCLDSREGVGREKRLGGKCVADHHRRSGVLTELAGRVRGQVLKDVENGLRLILGL
jgi:mRNA interferase MazF